MLSAVSSKTSSEGLLVTHSVRELLIDGYDAKAYEELGTEHNGAMSESGGDFTVPEYLMDGKYALFENVKIQNVFSLAKLQNFEIVV